ncbi:hypothetical protein F2Q69_00055164 [Brassica cretica]|uniref:Uncharacterized protein n=1 Tax=Brassica cretica TaxID=69181 RepID=A0A8S9MSK0_BRACR|nr:hypothetical protein F2Q69_00055164 [Brassica cretica]
MAMKHAQPSGKSPVERCDLSLILATLCVFVLQDIEREHRRRERELMILLDEKSTLIQGTIHASRLHLSEGSVYSLSGFELKPIVIGTGCSGYCLLALSPHSAVSYGVGVLFRQYIITINLWWDLTRPIREEANLRREEQGEEEKYKEVDYDENKEHREDGSSSGRGRR